MPLAMSRPWKHPKTGIYWLRKRVPDGLLKLVGKREELRTLGTRDPAEAKVRHSAALAEIEARWATLRAGPKQLSEREALDLAAPVGEWLTVDRYGHLFKSDRHQSVMGRIAGSLHQLLPPPAPRTTTSNLKPA